MSDPWLAIAEYKARTVMPAVDVDALMRHRWEKKVSDTAASSATPETRFAEIVVTTTVAMILLTASAAVVADLVDYASITISKRTAGGAAVTIATLDTTATDLPAGVPIAITIVAADVTAEDILTVTITKSGAGVVIPALVVDVRPTANFVTQALAFNQAHIEARLRKRYRIPFASPAPEAARRWLTFLTTKDCYEKRGYHPGSEQDKAGVIDSATKTELEVTEAANAVDGLFELPLRDDADPQTSAVIAPQPLGYSEQSPYVGFDIQLDAANLEDSQRMGTGDA